MAIVSRAAATWSGNLIDGRGSVSTTTSDAFTDLPITWSARTEDHAGLTSPEELLAAAHAACFSMAFSSNLTKAGTPPDRLSVAAEITFEKLEGGWTVVASALTVTGQVPGISAEDFASIADAAKAGCPISRALSPDIALSVTATLEG